MRKPTILLATAALACTGLATGCQAQAQAQSMPQSYLPQNGGAGLRTGHITSTGATVPDPGVPNSVGNTPQDRAIQHQDNKIDSSICKGC